MHIHACCRSIYIEKQDHGTWACMCMYIHWGGVHAGTTECIYAQNIACTRAQSAFIYPILFMQTCLCPYATVQCTQVAFKNRLYGYAVFTIHSSAHVSNYRVINFSRFESYLHSTQYTHVIVGLSSCGGRHCSCFMQCQVRYVGKVVAMVPHLTELTQTLGICHFRENKATDGLLGAFGLGKKSVYSLQ